MNTKLCKSLIIIAFVFINLIGFSACTKEYITEDHSTYNQGAYVHREFLKIAPNQWTWNSEIKSLEYFHKISKLTEASSTGDGNTIYDDGAMVASLFVNPGQNNERQEMLPFVYTYEIPVAGSEPYKYTETVSCSFVPDGVWFYIQGSDLQEGDPISSDYEFKISIFWD